VKFILTEGFSKCLVGGSSNLTETYQMRKSHAME